MLHSQPQASMSGCTLVLRKRTALAVGQLQSFCEAPSCMDMLHGHAACMQLGCYLLGSVLMLSAAVATNHILKGAPALARAAASAEPHRLSDLARHGVAAVVADVLCITADPVHYQARCVA